jgi:hypothetical protein
MNKIDWLWIALVFIGGVLLVMKDVDDGPNDDIDYVDIDNESELVSQVTLNFLEKKTSCHIDGEVSMGGKILGRSKNGKFDLSLEDYDAYWNGEVGIEGIADSCYGNDANLPIVGYWTIDNLDYYYKTGEEISFAIEINLRHPQYPRAMQGFIRPEEVRVKLDRVDFDEEASERERVETIYKYTYMNYVSDRGWFGEDEYWQTPSDFILNKGGDCEDWAIYFISLLRLHDPELECYMALWQTHANVLCYVDETFMIMDQDQVKKALRLDKGLTIQEQKIETRRWRNAYFEEYGISNSDRNLHYLFNEKDFIEFEQKEDFVQWVVDKE